jgi:hypothetical protein
MSNVECGKIVTDVDPTSPTGRDPDLHNTGVLPAGIITINCTCCYMARYVMGFEAGKIH